MAALDPDPGASAYSACLASLMRIDVRAKLLSEAELASQTATRVALFNGFFARLPAGVRVVHVAGSKGKGSVCELVRCGAMANGCRVGTFTSPHIHSVRERIRVGDACVGREDLVRLHAQHRPLFEAHPELVFFDKLLAVALQHFAEQRVDFLVLETGIGGRYDSTNFCARPSAAVITSISADHQAMLGDTLAAIAWQKAGIVKRGCPVFTPATQSPAALDVIRSEAAALGALLVVVGVEGDGVGGGAGGGEGGGEGGEAAAADDAAPRHVQQENRALAVGVLRHLALEVRGLANAFWPCRFERLAVAARPGRAAQEVLLDGAHNEDSMRHLAAELGRRAGGSGGLSCVFGAGAHKNVAPMMARVLEFEGLVQVVLVHSRHIQSAGLEGLRELAEAGRVEGTGDGAGGGGGGGGGGDGGVAVVVAGGVGAGMEAALARGQRVVVCGSLYVAAEARAWLARDEPGLFGGADWCWEADAAL